MYNTELKEVKFNALYLTEI